MRNALRTGLAAFAAAAALSAAACSLLLDTSPVQCKTAADCDSRGGAFVGMACENNVCVAAEAGADAGKDAGVDADAGSVDAGPWGCLGDVTAPTTGQNDVNVIVPLVDLSTQKPVTAADVFARICAKIDVNCTSPLTSGDAGVILSPDANGLLHLTLPNGFDGYVPIDPIVPDGGAPSDAGDAGPPNVFVPSLVFFNPPIVTDAVYTTIIMVRAAELGGIAQAVGTTLDPNLGALFMETVDCDLHPAAGVSIALDSITTTTQGFYFKGGLPTLNAPSTDVTGYAGFVNVPVTTHTVTGTVAATKQKIGTATVFTRQSTISYTVMAPSP